MDLYLVPVPSNPGNLHLVSTNGTTHYQITTLTPELTDGRQGPRVTLIQRPVAFSEPTEESVVAEIAWKHGDHPTVIRSPLTWYSEAQCVGSQGVGIKATKFLYQRNILGPYLSRSNARYFLGDDGSEFRWKMLKSGERKLIRTENGAEEATFFEITSLEGVFAGEKKDVLRLQACSIDVDLVVLTFMLVEIKRWELMGLFGPEVEHEGDPAGDGGADEGNAEGGFAEMLGEM